MASAPVAALAAIDYAVMAVYFAAVLGVGWSLRRAMHTSTDTYAPPAVWERFRADRCHGPRVVWGREVNL